MKKLLLILLLLFPFLLNAKVVVTLVGDDVSNELKSQMEGNVSHFLTEINTANKNKQKIKQIESFVSKQVKQLVFKLSEDYSFECCDDEIVTSISSVGSEYQIRGIPVLIRQSSDTSTQNAEYMEAVIGFDTTGEINNFFFSIPAKCYSSVVNCHYDSVDLERRRVIVNYVEKFFTSLYRRDIDCFINKLDGALYAIPNKISVSDTIAEKYNVHATKKQFIRYVSGFMRSHSKAIVSIDEIKVIKSPTNPQMYGADFNVVFKSNNVDGLYFFLLWDFTDDKNPKIHVQTCQQSISSGVKISDDQLFSVSDFDV